jgi:transmembrane sensor
MTTDLAAEHAVRTWTRRHSGIWTEADEVELQAWLTAAPEHRAAYDRVARVWVTAGDLGNLFSRREIAPRPVRRPGFAAACAAAVLVGVAIAFWHVGYNWWAGAPEHWIAERDKPREFVLGDGTRVLLDAGSELMANIGWHARKVSLRRGEALFTVAHDASRPFQVETGAGRLTDLGTRFDVEAVGGSTRIAVLEGRVGVSTARGTVVLTAGHGGGYDGGGDLLPSSAIDGSVTLWSAGRRHFTAEPLPEVLERLTRYHDVTFVFSEPRLRELRVSGTFRVDDLRLFLRTLGAALPLEARWIGPQRVEIRRRADAVGGTSTDTVHSGASR